MGLEGNTSSDQVFSENVKNLIQVQQREEKAEQGKRLTEVFNPNVFRQDVMDQIGHSLQVPQEMQDSPRGQEVLNEISDFLIERQRIEKIEDVVHALKQLLDQTPLPVHRRTPAGTLEGIFGMIARTKRREMEDRTEKDRYSIWHAK